MASPFTFDDTLRRHDKAVMKWLRTLLVSYKFKQPDGSQFDKTNHPIFSVFASPTRMGEEVYKQLMKENLVNSIPEGKKFPVPVLPIAGVQRSVPQIDPEWTSLAHTFVTHFDETTGQYIKYQWPNHYRTEYTITFLSKTNRMMNYIIEWVASQFGVLGAAQTERFLNVDHPQPFGTANQSFKLVGGSDLSEFEGDDQVFKRVQYTFSLRTWVIRPSIGTAEVVEAPDLGQVSAIDGNAVDGESAALTANLFAPPWRTIPSQYPTRWPTEGTASVRSGVQLTTPYVRQPNLANHFTLTIGDADGVDMVRLVERPYGNTSPALFSVEFDYASDQAVTLLGRQRDTSGTDLDETDDVINPAYRYDLPATQRFPALLFHAHRFIYITDQTIQVLLASTGTASTVILKDIKLQRVLTTTDTAPSGGATLGGITLWTWSGLDSAQPYLIHASITTTGGADATATVRDSSTVPVNSRSETINDTRQSGFVLLTQPRDGTLQLEVPATITLANVQARKYDGHYAGNEV